MRFRVLVVAAVAALAFAGCGEKADYVRFAETEGIYVDVGNLVYQVQLSRYMNPGDIEDRDYMRGLPAGTPLQAPPGEIWFGVFMRVKNYSEEAQRPTREFLITDTEGNEYRPIPLDPVRNVFSYNPGSLGPSQVLPNPNSAAALGPIQGSLILFKLKNGSLQNRPLVLHIEQPGEESAEIDLDL
jgi:hypothetical protein